MSILNFFKDGLERLSYYEPIPMELMNRPAPTCARYGPWWQFYCGTLGITYPKVPVWPKEYDWWRLSSYRISYADILYICIIAIALTWLRAGVQAIAVKSAAWLQIKKDVRTKFTESVWKTCFYSVSFGWGAYLVVSNDYEWLYDYARIFDPVPELYRTGGCPTDLYWFYMFQIGFYAHSIYAHLMVETLRKDFVEMLVHHVATICLVTFSYSTRFVAIGTVIVVIHDVSDVFFEIAKQFVYCENELLANVWFGIWVLSWTVCRLMYFPVHIVYGQIYQSAAHVGPYPQYATCALFLVTLQCLHIFWTILIYHMVWRMLTGQVEKVRDTREDGDEKKDNGEISENDEKKKNK